MKVITMISDMIEEELEGAESYIEAAISMKESYPTVSKAFYDISVQEMNHVNTLHDEVVNIISEYRKTNGEPPKAMMAIYEYLHEKHIKKANKIKMYQEQYKTAR